MTFSNNIKKEINKTNKNSHFYVIVICHDLNYTKQDATNVTVSYESYCCEI